MAALGFLFVLAGFVYVLPKGAEGGPTAWRAVKTGLQGRLRTDDQTDDQTRNQTDDDAADDLPSGRSTAKRFGVGIGLMAAGIALLELS